MLSGLGSEWKNLQLITSVDFSDFKLGFDQKIVKTYFQDTYRFFSMKRNGNKAVIGSHKFKFELFVAILGPAGVWNLVTVQNLISIRHSALWYIDIDQSRGSKIRIHFIVFKRWVALDHIPENIF